MKTAAKAKEKAQVKAKAKPTEKPVAKKKPAQPLAQIGSARRIGSLVDQLMARRGYAQVFAAEGLQASLEAEVGKALATAVRVGNVKQGTLHIYAADSVTLQELTFSKRAIIRRIEADHPDSGIRDLRFHVSTSARD